MYLWHYRPEFKIDYKTGQAVSGREAGTNV